MSTKKNFYLFLKMLLLAIACIVLGIWIRHRYNKLSFFKRLGIPGPEPHFFYGNLQEIWQKGLGQCQLDWTNKHGKLCGYYLGLKPIFLVSDKELLNRVEVKDMQIFSARDLLLGTAGVPDERITRGISWATGEEWKKIRNCLTPAFSTSKMKQIFHYINIGIDSFLKNLAKEDSKEDINIGERVCLLTADNILTTSLGVKTNVQDDPNDQLYRSMVLILKPTYEDKLIYLQFCLPELSKLFDLLFIFLDKLFCNVLGQPSVKYAFQKCIDAITMREKGQKVQVKDLSQLMMDSRDDGVARGDSPEDNVLLNQDTLVANALIMVIAGHDTVGSLLSFTCQLLALHQDIQDKVRSNISDVFKDGKITYENLNQLDYIDRVISEVLRLYPPSTVFVTRKSLQPYEYEGTVFPTGSTFQAPVYALHRNPEVWEKPNSFNPDRFSPEKKTEYSNTDYQPFGFGPRNCIGMRFALLEAKMVIARLFQTYKLVKSSKTEKENIGVKDKLFTIEPTNGVHVKLIKL